MIRGLAQADPRTVALGHPLEHGLHELAPDGTVLDGGIDRDRPHPGDRRPLIEDVTADEAAVLLGDDHSIARWESHRASWRQPPWVRENLRETDGAPRWS